ncbi:DMP19 family protein [Bartonella sp. HY761]|uniref:DMP19 family protein n=1 Tax=Bartonella sp. HY761 TaxID=2979330 RepID=UPI002201F133|nr:DUF4375 domain-containing protein [Bartonella sp. HY761]UXN06691.1 DMP19 family protein [Bartonella sp. HY761]
MYTKSKIFILFAAIGILTAQAQAAAQCPIHLPKQGEVQNLIDLKNITIDELLDHQFLGLANELVPQLLNPPEQNQQAYGNLKADQRLLAMDDDVQDIFWLYDVARFPNITRYFQTRDSDFAPYVLRALNRQNMPELASQFEAIMKEFDKRYDAFDPHQKNIIGFKILATQDELDAAFFDGLKELGSSAQGKAYIENIKQRRATAKANNRLAEEFSEHDYEQLYFSSAKTKSMQEKLQNFPNQKAFFAAIGHSLCQKPNLVKWYEEQRKNISDENRFRYLKYKLVAMIQQPGVDEATAFKGLPRAYQDIFSLFWFNMEITNGGIGQYLFNTQGRDIANLLRALNDNDEKDLALQIKEAIYLYKKAYPDELSNVPTDMTIAGNIDYDNFTDFDEDVDLIAIIEQVENLMYTITINENLIPH